MTRRDLSVMSLVALLTSAGGEAKEAERPVLNHSFGQSFGQLKVEKQEGGGLMRPVTRGKLPTGEAVEVHETTLMPGQMPHAAHKHAHGEFMLIREGTVEFTAGEKSWKLEAGGVAYAASEEMHGLKNVGNVPANYFVFAVGV